MANMTASAAQELLINQKTYISSEDVDLSIAFGRTSAVDVYARYAVPPFNRSPYDGYALRSEDTVNANKENPVVINIIEEIPAGMKPQRVVYKNMASKILTGAPVPEGADAIIKFEDVEFTESEIKIFNSLKSDSNIVHAGEDIHKGTLLIAKGEVITAAHVGLLAGQGMSKITVYCKPRIAVINTGSELLGPEAPPEYGKIFNCNSGTLEAFLLKEGADIFDAGIVNDSQEEIASKIAEIIDDCDMIIITGGASVGDYDWTKRTLEKIGARILFWKCAMKPGGAILAGVKDEKVILGLSGHPGSAAIGLLKIGLPYIRKMCGRSTLMPDTFKVIMDEPFTKNSPLQRMIQGHLSIRDGKAFFVQIKSKGNGCISPFIGCDLIGEIPAGTSSMSAGDLIQAFRV